MLLCFDCRRPLRDSSPERWRGEPVHGDCGEGLETTTPLSVGGIRVEESPKGKLIRGP